MNPHLTGNEEASPVGVLGRESPWTTALAGPTLPAYGLLSSLL